jgi:uncharacterized protein YjbJ (UPF0337 family)
MNDKSTKDKVIGKTKEVVGRIQKAAGDLTDDAELKAKGIKTEAQGKAQAKPEGFFGRIKETVGDAVDTVRNKVEEVTHSDTTHTNPTTRK